VKRKNVYGCEKANASRPRKSCIEGRIDLVKWFRLAVLQTHWGHAVFDRTNDGDRFPELEPEQAGRQIGI